ncbi:type III secretion system inner membrane ring lipoprotein SctJ [Yersinia kristensenii]|uniref:type III secretion system inner membrane ring lipoprotein SctJ n=1 Tax=Yersinia kristensenii TaxID=28152 RepID=UPI0005DC23A8|nr:type III secretion inner membrane ring lipoprotein SctJ [Yersinia kristensenii]CNF34422.1 type III secretion system apparatus lipoprotein [Yersinia kristensenii]
MMKYRLLPLLALLLVGCKQELLLKGLDQQQANEVIALLQRNNINVEKKEVIKEGYRLSVNPQDFSASVGLMNIHGLPRAPLVEIAKMFPADSLVSSPRAEKARLYSGIEQRLEQSLLSISGVVSARVHVSYDLGSSDGDRKKTPVHLSSILNHDNTITDTTLLVSDVKRFLKNSFEDVNYDDISVILSKINEVQRQAPVSIQVANNPVPSWLIFTLMAVFALLLGCFYFLKHSQHEFAVRIKQHMPVKRKEKSIEKKHEKEVRPVNQGGNTMMKVDKGNDGAMSDVKS